RGVARGALSALALARGDVASFGAAVNGSIFESARAALLPGFLAVCAAAWQAGAYGCVMSGAGPTVAAFADANSDAAAIGNAMREAFAVAGLKSEVIFASPGPAAGVVESRA